ncbi:MAG: potassium channel family protein [Pirellulaceae bacterium]|nr:potassium channel family protein [Pirellulaceae bacterium]
MSQLFAAAATTGEGFPQNISYLPILPLEFMETEISAGIASFYMYNENASRSRQTLRKGLCVLATTCLLSTVGYVAAGWAWLDAAYMVVITIFGVGYGEVRAVEGTPMKLFTMSVIVAGCSSLIYVIGGVVQLLSEGEFERMLGIRTRCRDINQLTGHTIICGYGRVGQMLAAELDECEHDFVVIDSSRNRVDKAIDHGFLAMHGDAVDDECLQKAGIFRAGILATVLPDDATNVFITLSARDLTESIRIIARAECPSTERKLIRSGADSVVMPAAIGAVRIAQLATEEVPEQPAPIARIVVNESKREPQIEKVANARSEVEELASIASDLTRSVARKHYEQVLEHEYDDQGTH